MTQYLGQAKLTKPLYLGGVWIALGLQAIVR
jgi:hypothetical protein